MKQPLQFSSYSSLFYPFTFFIIKPRTNSNWSTLNTLNSLASIKYESFIFVFNTIYLSKSTHNCRKLLPVSVCVCVFVCVMINVLKADLNAL